MLKITKIISKIMYKNFFISMWSCINNPWPCMNAHNKYGTKLVNVHPFNLYGCVSIKCSRPNKKQFLSPSIIHGSYVTKPYGIWSMYNIINKEPFFFLMVLQYSHELSSMWTVDFPLKDSRLDLPYCNITTYQKD